MIMKKNKVAFMMFTAAMLSVLVFGAIGDVVDEAYADPVEEVDEETEYAVEVFDIAFALVIILSAVVLAMYLKKK